MSEQQPERPQEKKKIDVKAFLSIIRPQNCFIGGLTVIAGIAMAFQLIPVGDISGYSSMFIFAYLTYFFVAAGGNVVNDIFDIEVDIVERLEVVFVVNAGVVDLEQAHAGVPPM